MSQVPTSSADTLPLHMNCTHAVRAPGRAVTLVPGRDRNLMCQDTYYHPGAPSQHWNAPANLTADPEIGIEPFFHSSQARHSRSSALTGLQSLVPRQPPSVENVSRSPS